MAPLGDRALPAVALVTDHAQSGGGESALLDLAKGLRSSGQYRPVILCREQGPLVDRLRVAGLETRVTSYPARFRRWGVAPFLSFKALRSIRPWLLEASVDLVHANGPFALLYAGWPARSLGRPVVFTSHLPDDAGRFFKRRLGRRIPSRILAVSRAIARRWEHAGVDSSRIAHVPLGIDPAAYAFDAAGRRRLRAEIGWQDEGLVVCGAIGRIQRVKGQTRFLEALRRARRETPALRGLIAGSPWPGDADARRYDREIGALAAEDGLKEAVVRLPSTGDVRAVLSAIDVLVVASDSESFGRIVLEAMACGRPVIATPCGGPQEIVIDGQTGIVADAIGAEALAAAMQVLARSPEERARMAEAGRGRVNEGFTLDAQLQRTMEIYDALIAH